MSRSTGKGGFSVADGDMTVERFIGAGIAELVIVYALFKGKRAEATFIYPEKPARTEFFETP